MAPVHTDPRSDLRSDAQLADTVAARLARPKRDGVDSFTLHAPLELLARTALLPLVEPGVRDAARNRLVELGEAYAAAGDEAAEPAPRAYDDLGAAAERLAGALGRGEVDDADAVALWLADHAAADELAALLADEVIPRLAAAGHGPILLWLLPRVAPRSRAVAHTLRGLVRELARFPDWALSWFGEPGALSGPDGADLASALRRPRSPGDPGSDFIFPTMSLVEHSGLAADVLGPVVGSVPPGEAAHVLLRVAAASMLTDDPGAAPYGWTHCLTMPQAVLGLARAGWASPGPAVAVAATYVLGFRSTLGRVPVDPTWVPAGPERADPLQALEGPPAEAASAAWHADNGARAAVAARLASWAAVHEDAHLAKYTLACFDAARDDPGATRLYLAAAAHLNAWWRHRS